MKMQKRQRVIDAISHRQTDIVPYNIELTGEEQTKLQNLIGIGKDAFWDWAGNHIEKAGYNIGGKYVKDGYYQDEFGVIWNRTGVDKDIGMMDEILLKDSSMGSFKMPVPDIAKVKEVTERLLDNGRDSFKFGKIGFAFYERAWSLRGMEDLLMDFLAEPAFVEELFENILNYNLQILDAALEYDIDGFYFGDDYGQQTGMIMSPDIWRKFIKPGLKIMFDRVKRKGKFVALHSCGNIIDIFGDLIDIGLDVYQTFQPELYDLKPVKKKYGDNLAFYGGISTQTTLPYVTPDKLKQVIKETIEAMGENGGYIAAPTHQVPNDVPVENIIAFVEAMKEQ